MEKLHIAISGIIGVGKTTLANNLSEELGLAVYHEPVIDNEYLVDFYNDMKANSFALQIYLLNRRFQQQQQLVWSDKGGVQDRSIYEDCIFSKMLCEQGNMRERDYRTYLSLFENMSRLMKRPNVIIYLEVSPEESLRRVKLRGRECEANITLEYLTDLSKYYEIFMEELSLTTRVIRVKWEEFSDVQTIAKMINTKWT